MRFCLSHIREHKFKYSFQDTLNLACSYDHNIETTYLYFSPCPLFHAERSTLLKNINETDSTILSKSKSVMTRILLYSNESFKDKVNLLNLNKTIDFVLSTNRFVFSEFMGVFPFNYDYNFTIFSILIFTFSYYFFCIPGTHNSHGARWLFFMFIV